MKPNRSLSLTFMLGALASAPAYSAETSTEFSFSPPPITEAVSAGEESHRFTGTYLKIDLDNALTGYGINFSNRYGNASGTSGKSNSWGLLSLSDESDTMSGLMFNANFNMEAYPGGTGNTIVFLGIPLGLTYFNIDTGGSDDASLSLLTYGLQVGMQHHIFLSEMASITPYVTYAKNKGKSRFQMGDSSADPIDSDYETATLTFGFDITLSGGISLASMLSTGDDNITMIQLGWNY